MKKTLITLAVLACATPALAETIEAPVVYKAPIYESYNVQVGTNQTCHTVTNNGGVFDGTGQALKGNGNALAGAIIGGVIGNQFGGGDGKKAATVLGVIVGSNMANGTADKTRQVCSQTPKWEQRSRLTGWNVTYSFNGMHHHAILNQDPGTHVTIITQTSHTIGE